MITLPDHPDDEIIETEQRRWTRGRILVITLVGLALIAIIVVHATGIVGG